MVSAKLKEYQRKRDFKQTAEPSGNSAIAPSSRLRFVIQKHAASRLHFDLRLELDGIFKSWAVTRGPSLKGLVGVTLRYPYEVREEEEYFDEIPDEKVTKDMLDLAKHIVEQKAGHFKPEKFKDHYEDALKELLKKKQHGEKIVATKGKEPSKVITSWKRCAAVQRATRRALASARRLAERRQPQRRRPVQLHVIGKQANNER